LSKGIGLAKKDIRKLLGSKSLAKKKYKFYQEKKNSQEKI
jgi:hypothetical protein